MIKGFKDFLMQGNVLDLAVAVIIGAAFGKIVDGLLEGLINPLIALLFNAEDLSSAGKFTIMDTVFQPGIFLSAIINFLIVAAVIYFIVIVPVKKAMSMAGAQEAADDAPAEDVALLTEIRDLLRTRA